MINKVPPLVFVFRIPHGCRLVGPPLKFTFVFMGGVYYLIFIFSPRLMRSGRSPYPTPATFYIMRLRDRLATSWQELTAEEKVCLCLLPAGIQFERITKLIYIY